MFTCISLVLFVVILRVLIRLLVWDLFSYGNAMHVFYILDWKQWILVCVYVAAIQWHFYLMMTRPSFIYWKESSEILSMFMFCCYSVTLLLFDDVNSVSSFIIYMYLSFLNEHGSGSEYGHLFLFNSVVRNFSDFQLSRYTTRRLLLKLPNVLTSIIFCTSNSWDFVIPYPPCRGVSYLV